MNKATIENDIIKFPFNPTGGYYSHEREYKLPVKYYRGANFEGIVGNGSDEPSKTLSFEIDMVIATDIINALFEENQKLSSENKRLYSENHNLLTELNEANGDY